MGRDPTPGEPPPQQAPALHGQLIQQLELIHASEMSLASDLEWLIGRTKWLPLRLILSDLRRETSRHLDRLSRLVPGLASPPAPVVPPAARSKPNGNSGDQLAAAAVIAGPLRAARAAVAGYGAAIATATERGLADVARLLTSSLTEKANSSRRLSSLAAAIGDQ